MLLHLDRDNRVPLHEQIRAQIGLHIDQGTVRPGSKLPPTRVLAAQLGVNRSTVYRAYQDLWAQGYLEARPGAYSTVRARLRASTAGTRAAASCLDFEKLSAPGPRRLFPEVLRAAEAAEKASDPGLINFSTLAADRELCPTDEIQRSLRKTISSRGKLIFDYGSSTGYRPLRESIAVNLRVHGVAVTADEILVTNGSQHGFDLTVRLLARPGAAVAMEAPSYNLAIKSCQQQNVPIVTVPMREDGMDLAVLAKTLKSHDIAFVYTIPNFHNPTGISTSQAHREELLKLCETHRVPLVEDGFEEELKYFGHAVLPIKSMDSRGVVIYLGTFSKVVFPGLRVGWVAAHADCVARLMAVSRVSALSGNMLTQAALSHFCQTGAYEEHVRRVHRAYRPRMRALLDGLEAHLPKTGVSWSKPQGGYTLMVGVRGRRKIAEAEAMERLLDAGVVVSPGSLFFPTPPDHFCFRLSLSNVPPSKIEEGCRRLGKALAEMV
jgi:GntR family transcriptional regulator/MocR family aminotransferase